MAPKVLWVGLGNMGRGMTKNLVEKGPLDSPLMLYNRSTQRATDLSKKLPAGKTEVIESLEDGVTKADIIFTCLSNDKAVQDTIAIIVKGDVKGKLIVDCSTIHPDTTELVAKAVLAQGAEFVASPVFGAPPAADAGQLIPVLAGPKAAVDKAKPYFKGVMARAEIDMSDEPYRKSSMLKILGNSFILNMVEQIAEGHVLAEKSGLGTEYLHSFLEQLFPGVYAGYSGRMLGGDYWKREEPLFGVDLARKDAAHAKDMAKTAGTKMLNVETADAHLSQVQKHAGSKGDIAGIYGAVRQDAGLKFENDA